MLAQQGYVPLTCTLPEPLAFPLGIAEVTAGRSPCDRCNMNRAVCKGKPRLEDADGH